MRQRFKRGCLASLVLLLLLTLGAVSFVWVQARRTPAGRPEYVALGSSFAAGAGLGALQEGSPLLCARTRSGYPQQLAGTRRLSIVDMSCGGAVTRHLLSGGQFFQGPQVRAISRDTRLVTITVGGNDVGYVGDLQLLAARRSGTLFGWLVKRIWSGPRNASDRNYGRLQSELLAVLRAVNERAPGVRIIVATYPAILPAAGTCPRLGLTSEEVALMRDVGDRMAAATRAATKQGDAILADMHVAGEGHNACSADPWTKGWTDLAKAPFHPTISGARATADAISSALDHQQL